MHTYGLIASIMANEQEKKVQARNKLTRTFLSYYEKKHEEGTEKREL